MTAKLRLCIVGPMLRRNSGWVTNQGKNLPDLCCDVGYHVLGTSSGVNRLRRLIELHNYKMLAKAVISIRIYHKLRKKLIINGYNLARVNPLEQRSLELIYSMKEYLINRKDEH